MIRRHRRTDAVRWLIAALAAVTVAAMNAGAASLTDLRWQKRVIAVFAPSADGAERARAALAGAAGLAERDIAWFVVHAGSVASNLEDAPAAGELRRLHRGDGFEAVLVGKDGGVKARQADALDIRAFNAEIDTMPMRQREMRSRDRR